MKKIFFIIVVMLLFLISCSEDRVIVNADLSGKKIVFKNLIGENIPSMSLKGYKNKSFKNYSLSSFRGKWIILFFYPADFTFVCPTELKELAEYYPEFKRLGAEILSVSTDSEFVHKAWHEQNELIKKVQYPMLSDRNGNLSRAMGVYNYKSGNAVRATFVVDPDGKIIVYEIHSDAIGRSADELLRKLNAAIAIKKGGGGYCAAGWKAGDKLLKE